MREGSLEAPTRHPIEWKSESFWDKDALNEELERVYDICHGCRRCVSLCDSFPTLFDLIDESETFEVDGVAKEDYTKVVDQCYLCDLCFLTKCPYVPPHDFNIDFPHLMLRAKSIKFKENGGSLRDRTLTSTDTMLGVMSIPLVDITINALNKNGGFRKAVEKTLDIHHEAPLPRMNAKTLRKRVANLLTPMEPQPLGEGHWVDQWKSPGDPRLAGRRSSEIWQRNLPKNGRLHFCRSIPAYRNSKRKH